jgi:hypothetical protein
MTEKIRHLKPRTGPEIKKALEMIKVRKEQETERLYNKMIDEKCAEFKKNPRIFPGKTLSINSNVLYREAEVQINDKYRNVELVKHQCKHEKTSRIGGRRGSPGNSYDNLVCDFCGLGLGIQRW